jgi:hypothetical protein
MMVATAALAACSATGTDATGTSPMAVPVASAVGLGPADGAFEVAGPTITVIGGIPNQRRQCQARAITGRVVLRSSPDGVLGVARLSTHSDCRIGLPVSVPQLLAGTGHLLTIQVARNADRESPAGNSNWTTTGNAELGFQWNGSWCGPRPTLARIALQRGTVTLPVTGALPACHGTGASVLIAGVTGFDAQPVESAPPEWRYLSATVHIGSVGRDQTLHDVSVDLTNSYGAPVALTPANYCIGVRDKYGDGTECEQRQVLASDEVTVPADGTRRILLADQSIAPDYRDLRGPSLTVTFAMAGIPPAQSLVAKP